MAPNFLTSWLPVSKSSARRPRAARLGVEHLEDRLAPAAGLPPDIVVGRTLSTYTVAGVQNSTLDVTYTVYNQTADDVSGVLLTTTLQPGVTFATASALPDRSGPNLAWSLGTIRGFDRASVTLTVRLPATPPLQIDTGVHAFATLNAGMVTDDAPAAALVNRAIPADQLASTPDANTTDPFVQEQAARLDYDPQRIFDYLNTDVGYESYIGSLRGARGTLWSAAGNSLDEASLGVALLRASGIPARYAHGTLSDPLAKQLILSMFSANFQTVGYIPPGTPVADPANDPQLLGETRDHFWVQFDSTGTGFVNADSSGLLGGAIGAAFTVATSTFTEVADGLRHKVEVKLDAEIWTQAAAALGVSDGLGTTTVLDRTFNSVDLVGRSLSIGNFLSTSASGALIFSSRTVTYSPFIVVGDEALPGDQLPLAIRGTDFQEVMTNFPLGNQLLTGLFLHTTLIGPDGPPETYDRALVDRIGFAARSGFVSTNVSVDPNGPPAINEFNVWTLDVSAGTANPSSPVKLATDAAADQELVLTAMSDSTHRGLAQASARRYFIAATNLAAVNFRTVSDLMTRRLAAIANVRAYFDSPRLILVSSSIVAGGLDGRTAQTTISIDLRRDTIRAVAPPGQAANAARIFNFTRGTVETVTEAVIVGQMASGAAVVVNTAVVFMAAEAQHIPLVMIDASNLQMLDGMAVSAEAKARITAAIQRGNTVIVPVSPVDLGGVAQSAWYEVNPVTGEAIGVTEDGGHQGILAYASFLGVGLSIGLFWGFVSFGFYQINHPLTSKEVKETKTSVNDLLGNQKFALASALTGGFLGGYVLGMYALLLLETGFDPDASRSRYGASVPPLSPPNVSSAPVTVPSHPPAGTVGGSVTTRHTQVAGGLQASWNSDVANGFRVQTLGAAGAVVMDANGAAVGTGAVSLAPTGLLATAVAGNNQYSVTGSGSLNFFGPAADALGVSGEWNNYAASVTGNVSITLTTDSLVLNGTRLPTGTYTITASAATLGGRGPSSSPNFAGTATVTATNGTVNLGAGSGNVTVGGGVLSTTNGATLAGYTGTISVAAGGGVNTPDLVTLNGTAANVLTVSTTPAAITADQNTPASFQVNVNTSLAGEYTLAAEAPDGWTVTIDATGTVTVTPARGLQSGTYPIRIVARSASNAVLVAQATVPVTVTAITPGITLTVDPDAMFTVPTAGGAQSPTAFRASIRNFGPATDTLTVSTTNLPAGFDLLTSGDSVAIPAGDTGILGVYLRPNGATLPAPGTLVSFTVTATSTSNPAITQTRTVTFAMPAVHGVTFTASPDGFGTVPGGAVTSTLTLTAVGNVPETVNLSAVLSSGLTATGLTPTLTLTPGQTRTIPVTLTAAAAAPLNSYLAATVTAQFNPLGDTYDQTVTVPVRVMVPGADAVATAAVTAARLSDPALSNRLTDLAAALTNLVQTPDSPIFRSQALAALDAFLGLIAPDPFVAGTIPALTAARTALAAAVTGDAVRAAVLQLGTALTAYNTALTNELNHRFVLTLDPNTGIVLPNGPATFIVAIQNTGAQATTYDLSVSGIAGGMIGSLNRTSVTLQPGEALVGGPNGVTVSVSQNGPQSSNNPVPSNFFVTATARGFSAVTLQARGSVAARPVYVRVPFVTPTPAFTDPGPAVAVSAKLLNAVNAPLPVLVSFTATAPGGTVVFTSTPTAVTLDPLITLTTVDLGTIPTAGLALGQYTLDVTVTDPSGAPLTGGTGRGFLLVGTPVSGSLTVSPTVVPPGTVTVANAVTVQARTTFPSPLALLGQAATAAPAVSPALLGTRAYVATSGGVQIVDVTDPANPTTVGTFGAADVIAGGYSYTAVVNGRLVVLSRLRLNADSLKLIVYDLTDPVNPTRVSSTTLPYFYAQGLFARGNTLFLPLASITFNNFSGAIVSQNGDVVAIDLTDPANPVVSDALFNTNGPPLGGNQNVDAVVAVGSQYVYAASTTSTGGSTSTGVGRVLVVDAAAPSNLTVARTLDIPGTVHAVGIGVAGNRALVVGTTGGWNNPTSASVYGYSGRIVLSVLDVTDPANPVLLATLVTANKPGNGPDYGRTDVLDLGGGRFAVGDTTLDGRPVVMVVDVTDPAHVLVGSVDTPAVVLGMETAGGKLYAAGATGLTVYSVGQLVGEPVTVSVRVPKGTGVSVAAGSFNEAPTQTITGPTFDTLVWTRSLGFGTTAFTFTWNTVVSNAQPNDPRAVTAGATIDFFDAGTPGSIDLPPTSVTVNRILAVAPPAQTVAPGGRADYAVTLTNPTATAANFTLSVQGAPAGWVAVPASVLAIPAGGQRTVTLTLTPTTVAAPANYDFVVVAGGPSNARDSFRAVLTVAGVPVNTPDSQAHGVVVSLTPAQAIAGQGTAAVYTGRVTNTGSETDTFDLTATGLPAGVTAAFEAASVTVPPGAGNFREVRLILTPAPGSAPGAVPFTVTAASAVHPGVAGTAAGTLTVVAAGVRITLDRSTAAPGESLTATVTNTGTAADTFDLAVAGPTGLVAALGMSTVTLGPGESRTVAVTTGATPFAVPGPLGLMVTATSRAAPAVRAAAAADLLVAPSVGLAARFDPVARTLAAPGTTEFLLLVDNTGNTEDAYTAAVVGTTGGLAAVLIGLDGLPTPTVPVFRLPGLSSGAILVRVTAAAAGAGTVAVRVASLADPTRAAATSAALTVGGPVAPAAAPTATPQAVLTDAGTPVAVTLAGTDPNAPPLPLTFTVVAGPAHGTLGPVVGGAVTYTPTPGYVGPDAFTFAASNGAAASAPATVSVQVRAPRPVLLGYHEFGVGAGAGHPAVARFFNPDGSERYTKDVFPGLSGGVRVTSADFNRDGVADLVAGTGPGSITRVVVFDGVTGAELFSIQPFEDRFTGGVFVAAGDISGDGVPDLVISPDESGGPRIRVFTGAGFASIADFYGIDDEGFRGGARAAVGDVNGDGFGDLVVSAGFGGGPRISVTDGRSLTLGAPRTLFGDFFLFEEALRNGAYVAAGDIDGDGFADLIGGGGPGGGPRVFALSGKDLLAGPPAAAGVVANFFGGNVGNRGGIRVAARDLDGDRRADLVVGDGSGAGSRVTGYLGKTIGPSGTPPEQFALDAYPGFAGGVFIG